jgi:SAM-dependent methyltransferase
MEPTERFTTRAGAYAASRPSYPPEAISVIIDGVGEPGKLAVADLGAGTGISARLIAAQGPHVYAVEPNAAMREAAAPDPHVTWVDGTAERTTLPAASVDIVSAFQAWHWFDRPAAVAEARRIVRPHGRLAVVYNERDESDAFTAGYGDIVRRYAKDQTERRRADALAHAFGVDPARTKRHDFVHVHDLDRAGVHGRADSSSYLPQSGPESDAMHRDIDALFDRFAAGGSIGMHLMTIVVLVDLASGSGTR